MEGNSLPENWVLTKIGEIADINPKMTYQPSNEMEVSFLPMKNVEALTGKIDLSITRPYKEVSKGFTSFQNGDVLFAKITPCMENGKVAIVENLKNGIGFGSTEFHVIRPVNKMPSQLFLLFLLQESVRKDAQSHMSGTAGQLRVPKKYIEEMLFSLPPLPEQHRIVAKIEELFTRLDAGVDALNKVKLQIKRYRQSVLKAAFGGNLTAEWREAHKSELETASILLEKIKAERIKSGKYKELPPLDASELAELPEGWAWTRVGNLYDIIGGGTPSTAVPEYWGGDIPWITSADIHGVKDITPRKSVTKIGIENSTTSLVPAGSLIVVIRVALGKIAITETPLCFSQDSQALLGDNSLIFPDYSLYYLSMAIQAFKYESRGTTISGVTKKQLSEVPFVLSPLNEQHMIVEEIERYFTIIDEMERTVERGIIQSQRLRQSILKQAFEGKLVPQDPNDEPAEKLLERIKAEKLKAQTDTITSRKKPNPFQKRII
jgi:type I restriction enzyme S subunit